MNETPATGADLVAAALDALGVGTVFAVPSAHNMSILAAIEERGTRIVGCRHEQGVAHAADAYARTTGALGVGVVSGGPGTANTMGGLYEAYYASSPVMLVTSQVETAHLGRGRGYVHEAEDQAAMLATVCREVVTAGAPEELGETVIRLARAALTGRPRPVALEVPLDVQAAAVPDVDEADLTRLAGAPVRRPVPAATDVEDAARVLSQAQRPVVWAGGGVVRSGAADELVALARRWGAPVLTSREGRGAISELDELSIGGYATLPPVRELLAECDVMLAVGTRFQMYPTAQWQLPVPARLVHLDVDPTVIGRSYPAAVSVVADARTGLAALAEMLTGPDDRTRAARKVHLESAQLAARSAREVAARQAGQDHLAISAAVAARRPESGVLVCDATVPAYVWGDRLVPVVAPRTSIRSVAAGIGPGMTLAVGAALGSDAHTVLLQGDGGFMLGLGELATAVQNRARIVICLFDDRGYGMLRDISASTGSGLRAGFDLATPDFHDLALSFGAKAARVADPAAFEEAFAAALGHDGPTLIHIDQRALHPLDRNLDTTQETR